MIGTPRSKGLKNEQINKKNKSSNILKSILKLRFRKDDKLIMTNSTASISQEALISREPALASVLEY